MAVTHADPGFTGVTVTHGLRASVLFLKTLPSLSVCSIFPSPEQNPGLCHYQGLLNTGGSLPDLSNLHFPSPLSTPLDPEDNGVYPNLSGGSSTGNLPAAMMHLGIGNSQGGQGTALFLMFHNCSEQLCRRNSRCSFRSCRCENSKEMTVVTLRLHSVIMISWQQCGLPVISLLLGV